MNNLILAFQHCHVKDQETDKVRKVSHSPNEPRKKVSIGTMRYNYQHERPIKTPTYREGVVERWVLGSENPYTDQHYGGGAAMADSSGTYWKGVQGSSRTHDRRRMGAVSEAVSMPTGLQTFEIGSGYTNQYQHRRGDLRGEIAPMDSRFRYGWILPEHERHCRSPERFTPDERMA